MKLIGICVLYFLFLKKENRVETPSGGVLPEKLIGGVRPASQNP